jgi:hypothetical protein
MPEDRADQRPSVVERWKMGKPTDAELAALPVTVDLVDVARPFGINHALAYSTARDNFDPAKGTSSLAGVPLIKLGNRSYIATRADLYKALGFTPRPAETRQDGAA